VEGCHAQAQHVIEGISRHVIGAEYFAMRTLRSMATFELPSYVTNILVCVCVCIMLRQSNPFFPRIYTDPFHQKNNIFQLLNPFSMFAFIHEMLLIECACRLPTIVYHASNVLPPQHKSTSNSSTTRLSNFSVPLLLLLQIGRKTFAGRRKKKFFLFERQNKFTLQKASKRELIPHHKLR